MGSEESSGTASCWLTGYLTIGFSSNLL